MKCKNIIFLIIIIAVSATCFNSCIKRTPLDDVDYAESYTLFSFRKMVSPNFYFDAPAFYKDGAGRVDIYLKVGYDKLVFLKESGNNISRYNCSIKIIDEQNDSIVVDDEFEKKIEIKSLDEITAQFFDFTLKSYKLPRGSFIVNVKISDLNSTKFFSKLKRVIIDFSDNMSIQSGDLLLVHKVVNDENGQIRLSPVISEHIPYTKNDTIYSFFEIYTKKKQAITLDMELAQLEYAKDEENDYTKVRRDQYQSYNNPWQVTDYKKIIGKSYALDLNSFSNQIIFPVPKGRGAGNFLLLYKIKSSSGKDSIIKYVRFNVLPEGFPKIYTIEDKIAVSKLARRTGEKNFFNDSLSSDKQYSKFIEFWSQSSAWNREEFFRRAEEANERFSTFIEGWKTEMGKVFIVCGEPAAIDGDRWIYEDNVIFNFSVVKDRGKYSVEIPTVILSGYTSNAHIFWQRMIDRIRSN